MSKNIDQVYIANPITSNASTDLMYFGQSPYGPGNDAAMTYANFAAQFSSKTLTSSHIFVGNGSNVATDVAMTGDVSITNSGVTTVSKIGGVSISLAGSFTTSGAFTVTQTYTGITNVTFPTSGTLATTSQLPTPAALTEVNDTNVTMTLGGTPTTALLQSVSMTLGWTGQLSLTRGGTNASLTASNGGIVYSTASAMAILAGTATARQMLQSGASGTPAWSTATWPATTTANQILFSSAANTVSEITTAANSVLVTSAGSVPSLSTTLPSGLTIPGFAKSGANSDITSMTGLTGTLQAPTGITSSSGVNLITFTYTPSAVNYISILNNIASSKPSITAQGSDSNVTLEITGKGTGAVDIVGTGTNDNAVSGIVGEFISSNIVVGSAVTATSNSDFNVTSISLTAGDWNVWGNVMYPSVGTAPTLLKGWINTVSATPPDQSLTSILSVTGITPNNGFTVPYQRISIASTTTVYLGGHLSNTSGNGTVCGAIYARRAR